MNFFAIFFLFSLPVIGLAAETTTPQTKVSSPPPEAQAAKTTPIESGQNTSALVEGKIFRHLEAAFAQRDLVEFEKVMAYYRQSFPQSPRKGEIEQLRQKFYYQEQLPSYLLKDGFVRLQYPQAKSLEELSEYFKTLKELNISTVILAASQTKGTPVYLFAHRDKTVGYYFAVKNGPMIENLFDRIIAIAHEQKLKVHVALPVRDLPGLSSYSDFILDESWNFLQNETKITQKLDLFHPLGKAYLYALVDDILNLDIDGVLLCADYAYQQQEGFSAFDRKLFIEDTGLDLHFDQLFATRKSRGRFGVLTREEFHDIALWRTRELTQSLWELIAHLRQSQRKLSIGIEVYPGMLSEEERAMRNYSMNLSHLKDLEVDYFYLAWKGQGRVGAQEKQDYKKAAQKLRTHIAPHKTLVVTVPLNESNKNLVFLNQALQQQATFKQESSKVEIAIGPINRYQGLDFVQYPRLTAPVKEAN